jgi:hypothetical protein
MMGDRHVEIEKRAYSLWEIEGRPIGRDLEHWLRAETEVQAACAEPAPPTPIKAERTEAKTTTPAKPQQRPAPRRSRRAQ